jgi:hypothetical protein
MKSVYDNIKFLLSLIPAVRTASANGVAVDTQGFGSGALAVSAGATDFGSGDETYVFNVEESADGSTGWAAIPNATVSITAASTTGLGRLEGLNTGDRKRYVRLAAVIGGTTPSCACSATFALGRAYNDPVN